MLDGEHCMLLFICLFGIVEIVNLLYMIGFQNGINVTKSKCSRYYDA